MQLKLCNPCLLFCCIVLLTQSIDSCLAFGGRIGFVIRSRVIVYLTGYWITCSATCYHFKNISDTRSSLQKKKLMIVFSCPVLSTPFCLLALKSVQPDMYPGNCWAFKGSEGYLVVRLSMKIYPTAFSLEHIPKTLSPSGNITSAPRKFSVYVSLS